VDETRYVSAAWDMWQRGEFLVPYLNGEPYSHKPPLLFWIMHLGWAIFGVTDWWPRLIAPLCALACVPLTLRLGRRLWPNAPLTHAVWVLFGTLLFAAFVTLTMFDLLLTLWVLIGVSGIVAAAQGERGGFAWLGLGIGLGVLTKGPVVLLHLLPVALTAPWWAKPLPVKPVRWYLGVVGGILLGAAIALAWAIPAGISGGAVYRNAIFWGQTAGRVAESFAHRAPWWYYLPLLPLLLAPWAIWPPVWRGLRAVSKEPADTGLRLLLVWIVLVLAGFSMISGKQPKYLVPLMPACALLIAHVLNRLPISPRRWEVLPPALGLLTIPGALLYARLHPATLGLPAWAATLPWWPVALSGLAVVAVIAASRAPLAWQVRALSSAMLLVFAVLYVSLIPLLAPYSDQGPMAQEVSALQRRGIPVAYLGKYHAQFNFVGRLQAPIEILDRAELGAWLERHPQGRVIRVTRSPLGQGVQGLQYERVYRGAWMQIWAGAPPPGDD
jgi:4-amino-4-deoxy-L-arabinose transferase-like glycosyltransferase